MGVGRGFALRSFLETSHRSKVGNRNHNSYDWKIRKLPRHRNRRHKEVEKMQCHGGICYTGDRKEEITIRQPVGRMKEEGKKRSGEGGGGREEETSWQADSSWEMGEV